MPVRRGSTGGVDGPGEQRAEGGDAARLRNWRGKSLSGAPPQCPLRSGSRHSRESVDHIVEARGEPAVQPCLLCDKATPWDFTNFTADGTDLKSCERLAHYIKSAPEYLAQTR